MNLKRNDIHSILVIDDDSDEFLLIADAMKEVNPGISLYFADSCEEAKKVQGCWN